MVGVALKYAVYQPVVEGKVVIGVQGTFQPLLGSCTRVWHYVVARMSFTCGLLSPPIGMHDVGEQPGVPTHARYTNQRVVIRSVPNSDSRLLRSWILRRCGVGCVYTA